jgi:hypothetical protein
MKQWLRQLLYNFLHNETPAIAANKISRGATLSSRAPDEGNDSFNFTVYNANGGKIVEVKNYDESKDRWIRSLHIITSDEDFGESIGKIVFLEMLKRG